MLHSLRFAAVATIASVLAFPAMAADITVGLITSMTGPGASIGIPYSKGLAAGLVYQDEVNGIKVKAVQLDDASDPSTGTRDARKLIEQNGYGFDAVDLVFVDEACGKTFGIGNPDRGAGTGHRGYQADGDVGCHGREG